mmetsp:Transcript_98543/g.279262  ORF Transcript_98543/g.279262 Transcript_98543/m.279262 type:complete len:87 (+) Transcript_98543:202-462(+)
MPWRQSPHAFATFLKMSQGSLPRKVQFGAPEQSTISGKICARPAVARKVVATHRTVPECEHTRGGANGGRDMWQQARTGATGWDVA